MWGDILLTLGSGILEHGIGKLIRVTERHEIKTKLDKTIDKLFAHYADSSIDTDEFYNIISSYKFSELLHNYFYTLKDGFGTKEYKEILVSYICSSCKKADRRDVCSFFEEIEELYFCFLNNIIEKDPELNALFQVLTISHRSIIAKLSERIDEVIRYINSSNNKKSEITDESINIYHHICENEYSVIRFTGISGAERKADQDINTFYIPNTFSFYNILSSGIYHNDSSEIDSIELKGIFDFGNKVVIVGGAGLGKTTSLNYLYCNYESLFDEKAIKIKIDLKEYAENIITNKKDILSCIADQFAKKTKRNIGLSITDIEQSLCKYLDEGRCIVIFDALDEIATQGARNIVRTEIANFCELYYLNRFIITTREVGYLKNKFDNSFIHLKIDKFSETQIHDYSENWFKLYHRNNKFDDFEEFWDAFNSEVDKARCRNLIENPIILILALVILDANQNLPNKKVEFYEKCVTTFLSEREIPRALLYLSEKAKSILGMEILLPRIAHYKYNKTNDNVSYKFTNSELKSAVIEAIEVKDEINWISAVNEYIRYLLERTELVKEIDDDILDFAHKTFFEYFLAVFFSKQLDINKLKRQLKKWIGDANNHEIAKLIVEMVIKNSDSSKQTDVIDFLFDLANNKKDFNRQNAFSLLVDLYVENLFPPKYHYEYYKMILNNGDVFEGRTLHRRQRRLYNFTKFNPKELADVYCQLVTEDAMYYKTIDALYYLNNEFKNELIAKFKNKELIKNTFALFRYAKSLDRKEKIKSTPKTLVECLNYFCINNKEHLFNSPLLLTCVTRLLVHYDNISYFKLENVELVNVHNNNYFYSHSTPYELISLIEGAVSSKNNFALLLLLVVMYSKEGTNIMLGFVLRHGYTHKENCETAMNFTKWIVELLYLSETYEEFEKQLKNKCLFSEDYISLYKTVYETYHSIESKIEVDRISEFLP